MRWLLRTLKGFASLIVALIILFEEWGWEPLARLLAQIGRLPILRSIERGIAALPPYAALAVFFAPATLLLPIKLLALWFVARGHAVFGLSVILAAKVVGTALVARIFTLTKPALMRLGWFARSYVWWTTWKEALLVRVRASLVWQRAARFKASVARSVRRLLGRN
jgi:hypothetical protein